MNEAERGQGVKTDVEVYLKELAKQGVLFFRPNPGNAGDSLIACATFQLFEENNLSYQMVPDESFDPAGKIVIYGGGGNLVSGRDEALRFIERTHHSAKKLVVLPHTIGGHEDLLGQFGSNVDLFVREEVSFEHVQRHAPHANVFLADDLALRLDVTRILAADLPRPYRLPLKQLIRRDTALVREAVRRSRGNTHVLNCFRTDKERTEIRRPRENLDLSKLFKCGVDTPEQAMLASHLIFQMLNRYDEVQTNRLHLAIAGALLGKDVKFYPNSYFKNEAVYNFSMKDRFPNVQWMGGGAVKQNSDVLKARFDDAPAGEVRMLLCANDEVQSVYFQSDDVVLSKHPEALVAAGLLPAMRTGKDLQLDAALDRVFEKNLEGVQDLFEEWGPSYRQINVRNGVENPASQESDRKRMGLFFSGGVDSFYTFLEHQDEVTDLIFVHGFDIRPEDRETCRRAEQSIRRIGKAFGKRVIKIETNVRSLLTEYGEWGERTHGAAMAAVAHLLGNEFSQIYIAASDTKELLSPWGSHPYLDPLWSSSQLEFTHDGCDASRPEKLRRVASSESALQNLRVCWKNRKGALNCGRCEKCIRTMIGLHVMGVSNVSNVFSKPLRVWRVMRIKIPHPDVATGQFYNLAELKKEPRFRVLYWALRIGFLRSHLRSRVNGWRSRERE